MEVKKTTMTRRVLILTACAFMVASAATAEPKQKRAAFVHHERVAIDGYFRAYPGDLAPGLAKPVSFPPGLQKQLHEPGEFAPAEKRIIPFPLSLEQRLGPPPAGLRRGCLGDRAVLYDPATSEIVDSFVISLHPRRGRL
jgi:hypothetical protein